jgi:hypothetical protein
MAQRRQSVGRGLLGKITRVVMLGLVPPLCHHRVKPGDPVSALIKRWMAGIILSLSKGRPGHDKASPAVTKAVIASEAKQSIVARARRWIASSPCGSSQ